MLCVGEVRGVEGREERCLRQAGYRKYIGGIISMLRQPLVIGVHGGMIVPHIKSDHQLGNQYQGKWKAQPILILSTQSVFSL